MQQANQKKDTIDGEDEGIISSCFSWFVLQASYANHLIRMNPQISWSL